MQQDELLESIYRVMSRANGDAPARPGPRGARTGRGAGPGRGAAEHPGGRGQRDQRALLERLSRDAATASVANNGREALALAEEGVFDLLLLDVHMPELDGFQVIRAIRERERSAGGHLPVIALTAREGKKTASGAWRPAWTTSWPSRSGRRPVGGD